MGENEQATPETNVSAEDMHSQRLQKIERMRATGQELYGHRVDGLTSISAVLSTFTARPETETEPLTVQVAGRLMARRIMGKSLFANMKDQEGNLQLYVQKNEIGDDAYSAFKELDIGDIVTASGYVFRTRTGEVSLRVQSFMLLSKAVRPLPEKFHGLKDTEQRYRQRYVDLIVNDDARRTLATRSRIIWEIRQFLSARGFMEVETPMMQSLAGGAAARPFITHYNALSCQMYLRIATELFLKRLLVGGYEKILR